MVPGLDPLSGGLHQYTPTILEALTEPSQGKSEDEYIVFIRPKDEPFISELIGNASYGSFKCVERDRSGAPNESVCKRDDVDRTGIQIRTIALGLLVLGADARAPERLS